MSNNQKEACNRPIYRYWGEEDVRGQKQIKSRWKSFTRRITLCNREKELVIQFTIYSKISKCQFSIKRELKEELQDTKITIKLMKCEPKELTKIWKSKKGTIIDESCQKQ